MFSQALTWTVWVPRSPSAGHVNTPAAQAVTKGRRCLCPYLATVPSGECECGCLSDNCPSTNHRSWQGITKGILERKAFFSQRMCAIIWFTQELTHRQVLFACMHVCACTHTCRHTHTQVYAFQEMMWLINKYSVPVCSALL